MLGQGEWLIQLSQQGKYEELWDAQRTCGATFFVMEALVIRGAI